MLLTQKLIGFLTRAFDKSPRQELAIRFRFNAGASMSWRIADGVLTTTTDLGGSYDLTYNLADYTVAELATALDAEAGYVVVYLDGVNGPDNELQGLKATVLLDGGHDQDESNGDHLYAYKSVLWAFFEPVAVELKLIVSQITQMLRQMVPQTAEDDWLDALGAFYAVDRLPGETDPVYANRIVTSVVKPAGNNVALEMAINAVTQGLLAKVTDAPAEAFTTPYAGTSYGLFDVVYDIDLGGSDDINAYASRVVSIVDLLRDAGTHLKSVSVNGSFSESYDSANMTDSLSAINVAFTDFAEDASFSTIVYDATYNYNGAIKHNNTTETLLLTVTDDGITLPTERI